MSSAYKFLPNYTYQDYCQWEGRWELIDGIPYAMAPLPTVKHQDTSGNLYVLFRGALTKAACVCKVYMPLDFKVNENTVLQPDLLIICKDITGQKFITEAPELVVEILSPSTAMKDLNTKFLLYQQLKVRYYLIVDTEKQKLEIYEYKYEKYEKVFSGHGETFSFRLTNDCSIQVEFEFIW